MGSGITLGWPKDNIYKQWKVCVWEEQIVIYIAIQWFSECKLGHHCLYNTSLSCTLHTVITTVHSDQSTIHAVLNTPKDIRMQYMPTVLFLEAPGAN